MARLGDAAQIDRTAVFIADDETDQIDIEGAAFGEILHVQHGVAGARDVEGRMVIGLRDAHGDSTAKAAKAPLPPACHVSDPARYSPGRKSAVASRQSPPYCWFAANSCLPMESKRAFWSSLSEL